MDKIELKFSKGGCDCCNQMDVIINGNHIDTDFILKTKTEDYAESMRKHYASFNHPVEVTTSYAKEIVQ